MNPVAARVQALQDQIDAIRAALEHDELDALPAMLDRYDAGVRDLCDQPGARDHADRIGVLRDSQQTLVGLMQERKAQLLGLIRRHRQSSQAASAYAGAGLR